MSAKTSVELGELAHWKGADQGACGGGPVAGGDSAGRSDLWPNRNFLIATPRPMRPRMIAFHSLPRMTAIFARKPVLAARPTAPPTTSAVRPYFATLSPGRNCE